MVSGYAEKNHQPMKTKLSPKKTRIKKVSAPTPNPEASQSATIQPGLEFFAELKNKTGAQQVAAVFPNFAAALARGDSKQIEAAAGLLSGFGLDLGVPVPEWAKAASRKFWEGNGFDFLTAFQGQASQMGKLVRLVEIAPKNGHSSKAKQAAQALVQREKTEAVNSPPEKHFEFAKGRKEAAKILEKVQGMSQRTKIFEIIAACWREVEKFNSTEELYNWLMSLKNPDGEYIIARSTDSREIRKICERIGRKFQNKWRNPKQ